MCHVSLFCTSVELYKFFLWPNIQHYTVILNMCCINKVDGDSYSVGHTIQLKQFINFFFLEKLVENNGDKLPVTLENSEKNTLNVLALGKLHRSAD